MSSLFVINVAALIVILFCIRFFNGDEDDEIIVFGCICLILEGDRGACWFGDDDEEDDTWSRLFITASVI